MKLKSMVMPQVEVKQQMMASPSVDQPMYPYGLRICLNNDVLKMLGIKDLPGVGEKMKLEAVVEVCSVSQYESKDGGPNLNMDLQIVEMGIESGKKADAGKKLYGDSEA